LLELSSDGILQIFFNIPILEVKEVKKIRIFED